MRRKDRPAKDRPAAKAAGPSPPLATSTAERLAAIVEAAERAAVTVIDDAERQARQHLEAAEAEAERLVAERLAGLSDLTDSLVAQAEEISRRSAQLAASLAEAKRRLDDGGPAAAPAAEAPERAAHLTAVAPVEEPPPANPVPLQSDYGDVGTPAGARLLATQMAVSGNSRAEIDARLRNGFDIVDTAAILDAILGPED
ncbi:MAG TPA: hypothetical protein VGO36_03010 [Solirubrobacterales bacterium]|nr:hypothetical protein [Solirubrobacterales bacterium]